MVAFLPECYNHGNGEITNGQEWESMARIKVFHENDHIIQTPQYLGGKEDNDYGNGFYTTEYEERARSLIS